MAIHSSDQQWRETEAGKEILRSTQHWCGPSSPEPRRDSRRTELWNAVHSTWGREYITPASASHMLITPYSVIRPVALTAWHPPPHLPASVLLNPTNLSDMTIVQKFAMTFQFKSESYAIITHLIQFVFLPRAYHGF